MAEDEGGGAGVLAEALGNMAAPSDPLRNEGEEAKGIDERALPSTGATRVGVSSLGGPTCSRMRMSAQTLLFRQDTLRVVTRAPQRRRGSMVVRACGGRR